MKTSIIKFSLLGLLAVSVAGFPLGVNARDTNAPAAAKKEVKTKRVAAVPFHGKLSAVDKMTKTITVGERKFQITSETKIAKAGKPALVEDGVVGEEVAGAYKKSDDGTLIATTVRFGAKPEKAVKPSKPAKTSRK